MTRRRPRSKSSSRRTSQRPLGTPEKSPPATSDPPTQDGSPRKALKKSALWAAGVLAAALAAVLTDLFLRLPPWVGEHLSGSGPALTVIAEPVFLNDVGRTLATPNGSYPRPQLLKLM